MANRPAIRKDVRRTRTWEDGTADRRATSLENAVPPTATWQNLDPVRRNRVTEAAMREFGRHGYSAGSLNTVARDAGVAKGSLFQYFDGKLDLFVHVAETAAERVRASLGPWLGTIPPELSYRQFLHGGVLAWIDFFREHPVERGVVAATHLEIDPEVRAAVHAPGRSVYAAEVRTLAQQAVARGDFRPDADPDAFTGLLSLLLPQLALAPFETGFDTFPELFGIPEDELRTRALRMVDAVYDGFAA